MTARVAVFASGEGTNLQALLDDAVTGPWIALVLSDRPGAPALRRAERRGVPTTCVEPADFPNREAYDRAVLERLHAASIDHVALAGFLRILGPTVVRAFSGRMINVHPSLLPAFPGTGAIERALAAGVDRTGGTVHFVDEGVDTGPIIAQETVSIEPEDDVRSLSERIHAVEHRLYPAILRDLVEGRIEMQGDQVVVRKDR